MTRTKKNMCLLTVSVPAWIGEHRDIYLSIYIGIAIRVTRARFKTVYNA